MALEEVIAHHLGALFPGMEIVDSNVFRVTRDADLEVSDDAADLLQAVEDELRRRRLGRWCASSWARTAPRALRSELTSACWGWRRRESIPWTGCSTWAPYWQIVRAPPASPSCGTPR